MLNYTEKLLKEEILNLTPIFLKSLNWGLPFITLNMKHLFTSLIAGLK